MADLRLNGNVLELDGMCVATLESDVRFEGSQRGRLEEALARTSSGDGDDELGSLLHAEVQALKAGIQVAIARLRANDHEAAGRILIEVLGRAVRASSDQAAMSQQH